MFLNSSLSKFKYYTTFTWQKFLSCKNSMSPGKPKLTPLYFKLLKQFNCKSEGKEQKTIKTRCNPGYYGGFNVMLFTHLWFSGQTAFYRKDAKKAQGFSLPPLT